jgi:uncharacterized phage protein (TIGR01671 family)
MRMIKFRAWDGEQMVSPDYVARNGVAYWRSNSIPTCSEMVMQFTGLHDKNGKEIYEGDLISIINPYDGAETKDVARVVFSNGYVGGWVLTVNDKDFLNIGTREKQLIVVGNIYENKKLLEANNANN